MRPFADKNYSRRASPPILLFHTLCLIIAGIITIPGVSFSFVIPLAVSKTTRSTASFLVDRPLHRSGGQRTPLFSSKSSPSADAISLEQNIKKARELLDECIFTPSLGVEAKHVLDFFRKTKPTDSESVNVSIALLERLVSESAASNVGDQSNWICDPFYFNPLFNLWKEASKQGRDVMSPRDLVQKLQRMSRTLPEFRYNIVAVSMIMQVVIKQAFKREAPFIAEDLLQIVQKEADEMQNMELRPNVFIYNNVLQAWAVSGLVEAPEKMESIPEAMRRDGVAPNEVTYTILLRYWATNRADVGKVEALLETMEKEGVDPSRTLLSPVIYCYVKAGNTEKAEELLQQMMELKPKNKREEGIIGESAQNILLAYRRIVDEPNLTDTEKEKGAKCAEALFNKMRNIAHLAHEELSSLQNTMMDIYARAGQHDQIEAMSQHLQQLDSVQLSIQIKSLGKADKADQATKILQQALADTHFEPDTQVFTALLNAWAESSRMDAVEQAFAVFRLLNEDPKCRRLRIKPNRITFGVLLKCISKSTSKDVGKRAVEILEEMERRYQAGDRNAKPDVISYTLVIKTCLQAGDAERAEVVMDRMENSDTPPTIRIYSDILNHWANIGTPEASELAERILSYMKQLADTKDPSLKPSAYSYNIVMGAWSKSGDPNACDRMWRLYEQMKEDNVEPDLVTFNTLISFFAKSKERQSIERADSLLRCMEQSKHTENRPDHRHFVPLIRGWMDNGDMNSATKVFLRFVNSPSSKPSSNVMGMVMQGWIRAGDLDRATMLIDKMQELKDSNRLPEGPDARTYKSLRYAWTRSPHPDKSATIQRLAINARRSFAATRHKRD